MDNVDKPSITLVCDCGHKFDVSVAGQELEDLRFTCPGCGRLDRLTDQQIEQLVRLHARAQNIAKSAFKGFPD